jgi:hypothetical protein
MIAPAGIFELSRPLPAGSTLTVSIGDPVTPDTVIATGYPDRRVLRLPAGGNFELLKKPGDYVKKGETVAVMEEMLGLGLRELVSPFDGFVESVNTRKTGLVITSGSREIRALVPGRVLASTPWEIQLEVVGCRLQGFFGFGRPITGELTEAREFHTAALVKRHLGPGVEGKVVLAASFVLPEVLPALARYGAAGLICGGVDFAPLWDLVSPRGPYPAGRGLPTVAVMVGFGYHEVPAKMRERLCEAVGRRVYVAGPAAERLVFAGPPHAEVILAQSDAEA